MNGFIALRPIPESFGAASGRPPVLAPRRRSGRVPTLPYPPSRPLDFTPCRPPWAAPFRHSAIAVARLLSLGPDQFGSAFEFVAWRDGSNRAVKPHRVVVGYELGYESLRIGEVQRRLGANALDLERLVPSLDLTVRLRIVW